MIENNNKNHLSQVALLASGFLYALYGPLTRITGNDFGEVTQTLIRAIMRVILIALLFVFIRNFTKVEKKDIPWFIISGLCAAGTTLFYTYAIQDLSMGTTMFLFYGTGTIVSFIIGKILYKEVLDRNKLISLGISFLGLLVLFIKDINFENIIFLIFACLAGVCYGSYSSFSKKISKNYSITQVVFSYAIIETVIYLFSILFIRETNNFSSITPWISNIVYAIVVTANVYLMVYGFKHIEAQKTSLLLLSELVFIIILGIILYREIPSYLEIIGSIFISIGIIFPNVKFLKNYKNK